MRAGQDNGDRFTAEVSEFWQRRDKQLLKELQEEIDRIAEAREDHEELARFAHVILAVFGACKQVMMPV